MASSKDNCGHGHENHSCADHMGPGAPPASQSMDEVEFSRSACKAAMDGDIALLQVPYHVEPVFTITSRRDEKGFIFVLYIRSTSWTGTPARQEATERANRQGTLLSTMPRGPGISVVSPCSWNEGLTQMLPQKRAVQLQRIEPRIWVISRSFTCFSTLALTWQSWTATAIPRSTRCSAKSPPFRTVSRHPPQKQSNQLNKVSSQAASRGHYETCCFLTEVSPKALDAMNARGQRPRDVAVGRAMEAFLKCERKESEWER